MNKFFLFKNGTLIALLVCAVFLVSCKNKSSTSTNFRTTYNLVDLKKIWKLKTDTLFDNDGESLNGQLKINEENDSLLTFFLASKKRLYVFNFNKQSLSSVIDFQEEGPNGLGPLMWGDLDYFINADSILIFNSNARKLYLLNGSEQVNRVYDLNPYFDKSYLSGFPSASSPLLKYKNYVFFINGITSYQKSFDRNQYKMMMRLDLNTGKITSATPLPEIYEDGYWGATPLYMPQMDIDVDKQTLLVSYPVSHDVFNYNIDLQQIDQWEASSSKISLEPFDKVNNGYLYGKDMNFFTAANQKYREQSYYHAVLVDPYKKMYYRINKLELGIDKIRQGQILTPNFTISLFDENHQKVGESDVFDGEKYFHNHVFVTPKGLAIGRKDLNAADEDHIYFSLFEAKKINE